MAGSENITTLPVSRRRLLAGATLLPLAPAGTATAAFDPASRNNPTMDGLRQRWGAYVRRYEAAEGMDDVEAVDWDLLDQEADELTKAIDATPAYSAADIVLKLDATLHGSGPGTDTDQIRRILAELRVIAGHPG